MTCAAASSFQRVLVTYGAPWCEDAVVRNGGAAIASMVQLRLRKGFSSEAKNVCREHLMLSVSMFD